MRKHITLWNICHSGGNSGVLQDLGYSFWVAMCKKAEGNTDRQAMSFPNLASLQQDLSYAAIDVGSVCSPHLNWVKSTVIVAPKCSSTWWTLRGLDIFTLLSGNPVSPGSLPTSDIAILQTIQTMRCPQTMQCKALANHSPEGINRRKAFCFSQTHFRTGPHVLFTHR